MRKHRNPRQRLSKRPSPDNFDPGILINQLYEDLVEVEALAVTADEAVTNLPPRPRGKHGRTLARLYTLVSKTSGRAQAALERGEELMALRAAQLTAQVPKRSAARRAVDRSTLEKLLHHATFAAHLVGHLDDDAHRELIRQIGDHVDTIAHELTELLGALAEQDAAAPDDRGARDGAPMLTSIAGGHREAQGDREAAHP